MFPDPGKLAEATPVEVLEAAARGHLGLDHRFLHALLDRPEESLPAAVRFAERDRRDDTVDLASELIALFRHWKAKEGIPFLIGYIKEDPENVPDEVVEALVELGQPALDPLLTLYSELDESQSSEVAFILANLQVRDERILKILADRLEYDLSDTALLLGMYGGTAAKAVLEKAAAELQENEAELKKEVAEAMESLDIKPAPHRAETEPFDIWSLYPEEEDLPVDLLDEDLRTELLQHAVASVRAAAAHSFFNQQLSPEERKALLRLATGDESVTVRACAWEALIDATEEPEVIGAMLHALRRPELSVEERGGLLVGLAPETDRNEVRKAIADLYTNPKGRAKALEAMWRSVHPSFRDYFARHLNDSDVEIRRAALWGIGYYGLSSELDKVRKLFNDEELRSDALFAFTLAMPGDISRGRVNGLLARIEREAKGLSEMEEELVKAALDERLMLAGKEPVFRQQDD